MCIDLRSTIRVQNMIQWLRTIILGEDPGLILNTHTVAFTIFHIIRGSSPVSELLRYEIYMLYTYIHADKILIHIKINQSKNVK